MGTHSMACEVLPQCRCEPVFLTCILLQGNKTLSDHRNSIMVSSINGKIILDVKSRILTVWSPASNFYKKYNKRAKSATAPCRKNINDLHVKLRYPSESITCATAKALGIQVTSMFKLCEDCASGKAKQCDVNESAVPCSKILGERLSFDISSPSIPTFSSKQHWLLVVDDCSDFIWSFFLKEKFN